MINLRVDFKTFMEDENDKLMRFGNPDSVGYWVYESLVMVIE